MVLPRFVRAALENRALEVYGDGRQIRCFCDVRDVTRAVVALLGRPGCHGRVFNVGCDRTIAITELADLVIRLTGSDSVKKRVSYRRVYGRNFDEPRERRPDLRRLRKAIAFTPEWSLEETILDVASSMREVQGRAQVAVGLGRASISGLPSLSARGPDPFSTSWKGWNIDQAIHRLNSSPTPSSW